MSEYIVKKTEPEKDNIKARLIHSMRLGFVGMNCLTLCLTIDLILGLGLAMGNHDVPVY